MLSFRLLIAIIAVILSIIITLLVILFGPEPDISKRESDYSVIKEKSNEVDIDEINIDIYDPTQ